jgi:hypothetical protein
MSDPALQEGCTGLLLYHCNLTLNADLPVVLLPGLLVLVDGVLRIYKDA